MKKQTKDKLFVTISTVFLIIVVVIGYFMVVAAKNGDRTLATFFMITEFAIVICEVICYGIAIQ